VDAQDLGARVLVGVWELDLAVQPPTAHEGRVQDVCTVGGRNDLKVGSKAIGSTGMGWVSRLVLGVKS
jgi:hypothetical protein